MAVKNNKVDRYIQYRKQVLALHCTRSVVLVEPLVASKAFGRLVTEVLARQGELFEPAALGFAWRTQLRNC